MMFAPESFFALDGFVHADLFARGSTVWDGLSNLKTYMARQQDTPLSHGLLRSGVPLSQPLILHGGKLLPAEGCDIELGSVTRGELRIVSDGTRLEGASLIMAGAVLVGTNLQIGRGVLVESGAWVREPTYIGDNSEVRQGAYLRGHCLVGERCVVGHATEVKHSIFLNDAKAGHFAYVGDSILGGDVNLGAGTKLANLRFIRGEVHIRHDGGQVGTGLNKLGAIFGDRVQTGCNSVTSPGTLIGPDSLLMPNATAPSGYHGPRSVLR